ncbi:uncharacterized protein LOC135157977 [Lytechinus pictus]|uniref:uncharacterized protein LOC135157977 n=1 Tax=Lytechinus pictus TaxID=7653 RepID=UPI0030B9DD18
MSKDLNIAWVLQLTSLEDIKSYREIGPAPSVKSIEFGADDTLETALGDHGVSVIIPSDAIRPDHSCRITVTLLEHPSCLDVQEDESLACRGIKCDPGDMIFNKPVMIRIPHCFSVTNPDQVRPDIVSYEWDSVNDLPITSRRRSSTSPDKPPYCRVYGRHLELYIDYCAEWWVLIPLEQQLVRQKLICTPYIPDKIDKGKKIDFHLHLHANLPGMDADAEEEERKQSYHKAHPSVPINVATKSGDLDVVCHREGHRPHRDVKEVLPLKDVHSNMRNRILLPVTVHEEDVDFPVTITIAQTGKLDVAIYFAFVFNSSADDEEQDTSVEIASSVRVVRGISGTDIQDVELHSIAEKMSVNHFYDLGIALGFRIPKLDAIEYMQLGDRQQAMYQLLVKWKQAQPSGLAAKDALLSVMESLDLPSIPSEDMQITG